MISAFRFLFHVIGKKREKEWEKADDILISSFLPTTALFFAELGFSDRRIGLFMSMTL